jgi:cytochrome oxidase Cu insertion factor (SCO1/SenC/PrrC family)
MTPAVRMWLTFLLVSIGSYAAYSGWRIYSLVQAAEAAETEKLDVTATPIPGRSIRDVSELEFTTSEQQPFQFRQLDGKVWVGSFFFSSCPGPCRQINVALSELQKDLKDKDIQFVSLTVDPDIDTPAVLHDYAKSFGADFDRWHFLTGRFDEIRQVCQDVFAMPIEKKVHTERLMVFDRSGRPHGPFSTGEPAQMLALKRTVDKLLAEPVEAAKQGEPVKKDAS